MENYAAIVQQTLAEFETVTVPTDRLEEGKAQLTRRAAYALNRINPNIGLLRKTGGNAVEELSVDVIMDRSDGTWADIASSSGDVVRAVWVHHGERSTDRAWLALWVEPTAHLADLAGPMRLRNQPPGPPIAPPPPAPPPAAGESITYDQFVKVEADEVWRRYLERRGHPPAIPDMYHNAWRRLREGWSHADILKDI
jgi:hypothetical protein